MLVGSSSLAPGTCGIVLLQLIDATEIPLHPRFAQLKAEMTEEYARRREEGDIDVQHNSTTYKLLRFDYGRRDIIDGTEVPTLVLNYGPTDYYTSLVTDWNKD